MRWPPDSFVYLDSIIGAVGRRTGALFFARHLDYFIVTQNSQPSPGLGTVKTNYRDQTTPDRLPGLAKNAAPRHGRQLIKPPGHYSQCDRYQRDRLHRKSHVIYRDRIFGTFAFARHSYPNPHAKAKEPNALAQIQLSKNDSLVILSSLVGFLI